METLPTPSSIYDVAIIGGGINGAAVAHEASRRGLKVILFEKNDFGFGASSATSKLAHGGLRYLEQFDLKLVKQSLMARNQLLNDYPRLVKPLPFIFPIYAHSKRPKWQVRLGLLAYDFLASESSLPKHKGLSSEDIAQMMPDLRQDQLNGGFLYYDAQMKDNRLVMENLLQAESYGAKIFNYTEVCGITTANNKVTGLRIKASADESPTDISARFVINTAGAWSNHISQLDVFPPKHKIKASKGVHIVVPQISSHYALILTAPQDQRIFFVMPWMRKTLIGTTDTYYGGPLDQVEVTENDIQYLLDAYNSYFPHRLLTRKDIVSSFAGVRPLIARDQANPSELSRQHVIDQSPSGLFHLLGGKFTTFRLMAQEMVNAITLYQKKNHAHATNTQWDHLSRDQIRQKAKEFGLQYSSLFHIIHTYASQTDHVLSFVVEDPALGEKISPDLPHIKAEIDYAVKHEHLQHLEDWFFRRTYVGHSHQKGLQCASFVADRLSLLLNWDSDRTQQELNHFLSKYKSE